jgi:hypothetical protein
VDEYSSMDDTGYIRRSITNQQDFAVSELDFLRVSTAGTHWLSQQAFIAGIHRHGQQASTFSDSENSQQAICSKCAQLTGCPPIVLIRPVPASVLSDCAAHTSG